MTRLSPGCFYKVPPIFYFERTRAEDPTDACLDWPGKKRR